MLTSGESGTTFEKSDNCLQNSLQSLRASQTLFLPRSPLLFKAAWVTGVWSSTLQMSKAQRLCPKPHRMNELGSGSTTILTSRPTTALSGPRERLIPGKEPRARRQEGCAPNPASPTGPVAAFGAGGAQDFSEAQCPAVWVCEIRARTPRS